jgi:hypothetical protein
VRRQVASVLVTHYGLDADDTGRPLWPSPVVMAGVALSSVAVLAMTTGTSIHSPASLPPEGSALAQLRREFTDLAGELRQRITIASQRLERVMAAGAPRESNGRVVRSTRDAATTRIEAPTATRLTDEGHQGLPGTPATPKGNIGSPARPATHAPLANRALNRSATEDPGQGTPDGPPLDIAGRETARAPVQLRDSTVPRGAGTSGRDQGITTFDGRSVPPERPDKAGPAEWSEKSQRPERVEKAGKIERVEKVEKVEKLERPAKPERPEKVERVEKLERLEKPAKPERVEKVAKVEKPERVEKPTRPGK